MRGVTCDGCNLKYLFDGSRPCPRCGTLAGPFEATNEARPAAQASPFGERAGGVVIGLMGAGMLAANVAAAHFANRYYPAIAVLGGVVFLTLVWITLQRRQITRSREGRHAEPALSWAQMASWSLLLERYQS